MEPFWRPLGAALEASWGVLQASWRLLRSSLAIFFVSWSRGLDFEAVSGRLGAVLEASWDVLEASWRLLRSSLARFFASWSPCRIRDLFSNELEPSWTSFLNDF